MQPLIRTASLPKIPNAEIWEGWPNTRQFSKTLTLQPDPLTVAPVQSSEPVNDLAAWSTAPRTAQP